MLEFIVGFMAGTWLTLIIATYFFEQEKDKEKNTDDKTKR